MYIPRHFKRRHRHDVTIKIVKIVHSSLISNIINLHSCRTRHVKSQAYLTIGHIMLGYQIIYEIKNLKGSLNQENSTKII